MLPVRRSRGRTIGDQPVRRLDLAPGLDIALEVEQFFLPGLERIGRKATGLDGLPDPVVVPVDKTFDLRGDDAPEVEEREAGLLVEKLEQVGFPETIDRSPALLEFLVGLPRPFSYAARNSARYRA